MSSYDTSALSASDTQNPAAAGEGTLAMNKIVKKSSAMTVVIAGLALFSDGYTAGIIGYMEPIFSQLYKDAASLTVSNRLASSFLIGEIFGMLFFGVLIDRVGRRAGVVAATGFLLVGIVLSAAAHGTTIDGLFWMMIIGRGVAGFGAGGEYSTCGASATEAADETESVRRQRGILVAMSSIFAIDLGFVAAGIVAIVVLLCYQEGPADGVWRICFGIAVILPLGIFIFRFRVINSTQYRKHAIKRNMPYLLALRLYWKPMLGSALTWFCYDFVRYPFGLFSSTIIGQFNPSNTLLQNIGYGTLVNAFYIPGTIAGGFLMDSWGRRQTMWLGFVCLGVIGFVIGGAFYPLLHVFPLFVTLYGIFNASGEMGPGASVFLCSTEPFPTPLRGHFLGFAAAMGKVGAAIGIEVFNPIIRSFASDQQGQQAVFLIGSAFALAGSLGAWFLLPDKARKLEDEDARFRQELVAKGYDLSCFGECLSDNLNYTVYEPNDVFDEAQPRPRF